MCDSVEIPKNELRFPNAWSNQAEGIILGEKWTITKKQYKGKNVIVKVYCNKGMHIYGVDAEGTIKIEIGKKGEDRYSTHKFKVDFHSYYQDEMVELKNYGEMSCNDLLTEEHFDQSALDDMENIHISFTVESMTGPKIYSVAPFDFYNPRCRHDKVLVMDDGTRFYVNSEILSTWSAHFDAMFHSDFAEAKQDEIPIGEVTKIEFDQLLKQLYPGYDGIKNVEHALSLLSMADRFDMPGITKRVVDYLCGLEHSKVKWCVMELMEAADQYQIVDLQNKAYKILLEVEDLVDYIMQQIYHFRSLPVTAREKILLAFMLKGEKAKKEKRESEKTDSD